MDEQQFVLRWHYHEATLLSGLPKLLDSELLTDITLSVGCRKIKAHRVVLATCSSYFLQLFQDMGQLQHPVIILQDTDFNDLSAIISFIYRGHCLVSEKQLPSVLAAAKLLQIRGLCDFKVPESKAALVDMTKDLQITLNESTKNENMFKEKVTCDKTDNTVVENVPQLSSETSVISNFKEKSSEFDSCPSDVTSQWKLKNNNASKCFICGKYLSNQYNLRVHMETHEDGYHACYACPHVSRSRDALRKHISYRHPDESTSRKRKSKMDIV